MDNLINIKNLINKRKVVFLVFFILISFQLFYGFISPTYDASNPYWRTIEGFSQEERYSFSSTDSSIANIVFPILTNYHINSDAGGYILLAHDFPEHYFKGNFTNLNRPLYSILVYLVSQPFHLISNSYALTFAAGIFVNFILFFLAVILSYSLVEKIISKRVAFLSSLLLIFSPFAHIWLVQPETNIFGVFAVALSLYLLYNYIKSPTFQKLILFSLAIGVLLLGKMLIAISIFILLLAFYFKRYKEGIIFLLIHLIPRGFWYFWVTQVFGLKYFSTEVADYNFAGWLFNIFQVPWQETFKVLLDTPGSFTFALIYGFLLFPILLAIIGFKKLSFEKRNVFCFSFAISFFLFFLLLNYYTPRHAFLVFPIVYPLAVLGIDRLAEFIKRYKVCCVSVFYLAIYLFLIIISNVDVFKIFRYDIGFPWLE